jgi:hypothetical protein
MADDFQSRIDRRPEGSTPVRNVDAGFENATRSERYTNTVRADCGFTGPRSLVSMKAFPRIPPPSGNAYGNRSWIML